MSLVVLNPGLASRIVDDGRPRSRSLGVPVGGAADRRSLSLGNALVGNPPGAPALEIALQGPRLRAEAEIACVLFGAPFDAHRAGERVHAGHTFNLQAGDELRIAGTGQGVRAYVCVPGGLCAPRILGSSSGLESCRKGEVLECAKSQLPTRFCPDVQPSFAEEWTVRVLPGLQASWFDQRELCDQTFGVTPASNRMGLRLVGKALTMPNRELVSEPVCPGSVQVTNDGQCIVLGVDGQTIGGYPKIAQVIQADLDILGQVRPNQMLRFTMVTMPDAVQLARRAALELNRWGTRLRLSLDAFPTARRFDTS